MFLYKVYINHEEKLKIGRAVINKETEKIYFVNPLLPKVFDNRKRINKEQREQFLIGKTPNEAVKLYTNYYKVILDELEYEKRIIKQLIKEVNKLK